MSQIQNVADAVAAGKAKVVGGLVQEALDAGCDATELLNAMIDAMGVVGERFKKNEIFVPEMLIAAKAMKKGVEVLKPHLAGDSANKYDLGVDVSIQKFIDAVNANPDVKIVGCSALLTTTMPALKDTVAALNEAPFRKNIKVMVGGAPITQEFADEIGADAYTPDAASAAQKAKELAA